MSIYRGWQQSTINVSSPGWQQHWEMDKRYGSNAAYITGLIDAAPWLSGSLM